jgi:membrane associated rhomboid family serine protease
LREIPRYPLTTLVAVSSVGATLAWWRERDVGWMFMTSTGITTEPWRLVTSTLLHADVLHLAFNLYWLWVFGTVLETASGRVRYAGLLVLFAAGASAAQFAMSASGVGLSGVGYGLFTAIWVLSVKDDRFRGAVDRSTVTILVGWFFLCIVTTVTGVLSVGNWAHGAGAALGALLGAAVATRGRSRALFAAGLAGTLVLIGGAASAGRTRLNRAEAAQDLAHEGWLALDRNDDTRAAELYTRALALESGERDWWINLGIAEQRRERFAEALDAYEQARALGGDAKPEIDRTACGLAIQLGEEDLAAHRGESALARARIAVAAGPNDARAWRILGSAEQLAGNAGAAARAFDKATTLSGGTMPDDPSNSLGP